MTSETALRGFDLRPKSTTLPLSDVLVGKLRLDVGLRIVASSIPRSPGIDSATR
ncbi:MAG: hypothetical protein JO042_01800 [Sinobacteraceae bacterium]|nr:hypothetical protein [Nevskiaceae bacterium]